MLRLGAKSTPARPGQASARGRPDGGNRGFRGCPGALSSPPASETAGGHFPQRAAPSSPPEVTVPPDGVAGPSAAVAVPNAGRAGGRFPRVDFRGTPRLRGTCVSSGPGTRSLTRLAFARSPVRSCAQLSAPPGQLRGAHGYSRTRVGGVGRVVFTLRGAGLSGTVRCALLGRSRLLAGSPPRSLARTHLLRTWDGIGGNRGCGLARGNGTHRAAFGGEQFWGFRLLRPCWSGAGQARPSPAVRSPLQPNASPVFGLAPPSTVDPPSNIFICFRTLWAVLHYC